MYALLWGLGLSPEGEGPLRWPEEPCDMKEVVGIVKRAESAAGLRVRGVEEMLDQLDLHYRITWASAYHATWLRLRLWVRGARGARRRGAWQSR